MRQTTLPTWLLLTDSYLLPGADVCILAIVIDGRTVWVEKTFKRFNDFYNYLNRTFRAQEALKGYFDNKTATQLHYKNWEGFKKMEIMGFFSQGNVILKIGTPDMPYYPVEGVVAIVNGEPLTTGKLDGMQVLSVALHNALGYSPLMPGQWVQADKTLTIAPGIGTADSYIIIQVQQVAPSKTKTAMPQMVVTVSGNLVHFDFTGEKGADYLLRRGTTPDVAAAVPVFTEPGRAYFNYTRSGSTTEYFWLYATAGVKEISNPATYILESDTWIYPIN